MEHTPPPPADPADPPSPPEMPAPDQDTTPGQLRRDLVDAILASGQDPRPGRDQREDGWTPQRIAIFLNVLAECGIVRDACRAAGVTRQAAYALRNSAKGSAFGLAWRAAVLLARRRIADDLMSRAVNGQVDRIYRDGELWRERHRFDNRLGLALLTRLDREVAEQAIDPAATLVAEEFEQFVEIVAKGGEGAAEFVRCRAEGFRDRHEADVLQRSENYGLYGVGHPHEIDVTDIVAGWEKEWSREQIERGIRAGVLRKLRPHESDDEAPEPGCTRYVITLPDVGAVGTLDA